MKNKKAKKKQLFPKFSTQNINYKSLLWLLFIAALIFRISLFKYRFAVVFDEVD